MEFSTRQKIIGLVVYTSVAIAIGRYLAPEKVRIETTKEVVKDEKTKKDKNTTIDDNKKTHKETTTTTKTLPDGSTETTTKVIEDTVRDTDIVKNDKSTKDTLSKESETSSKTIERGSDKVTILALAGINPFNPSPTNLIDYGISVSKPILGPVTVGVWGFKSGQVGLGLGLQF